MFCPKCGKNLPNGSKFCSACGEKLAAPETVKKPEVEVISGAEVAVKTTKTGVVQYTNKFNIKKLVPILCAAAAVVLVIFLVSALFSGGVDGDVAYLSDGRYRLITNLDKGESLEIASAKSDYTRSNMLSFSPDGKYIYYFTKIDYSYETGTLCRAEYSKLKKDSSKNDKYIEIIATNVQMDIDFLEDGTLLYQNSENNLYYYNGKESVQIAKDVTEYHFDENNRVIYLSGSYYDGYSLYAVNLKEIDNKIKLDSGISELWNHADFENLLYVKAEDDDTLTLYTAGFDKEIQKLGEQVSLKGRLDNKLYFTMPSEQSISMYDFVRDDYAAGDAAIQEPTSDDYAIPKYSYDMVYGSNLVESDFDELYTSCTRDLYWYGESTWWCYSMEDALDMDWGDNTEALVAATQNFIDKFGATADENGYIRVTPEVKAALQEIQVCADHPENEWQWLWLCYNKYQSGTTTDYEAYEAAYDLWYEAQNRNYLRENLKDPENNRIVYTMYCFEEGKVTTVYENILSGYSVHGGYVFNSTDMFTEKLSIDEIDSAYDVYKTFNLDDEAQNNVLLFADGKVVGMSLSATDAFHFTEDVSDADIIIAGDYMYMFAYDYNGGILSAAEIKGGEIGAFTILSDDAESLGVHENTLYYAAGTYENNGFTYCDLYACEKGKSTRLAQDIMRNDIRIYSDGQIAGYSGYRSGNGYELTLYNSKGEPTLIGDGISKYVRVDKSTLLYVSDGDLFYYNGKERTMVAIDVSYLWTREQLEIIANFKD